MMLALAWTAFAVLTVASFSVTWRLGYHCGRLAAEDDAKRTTFAAELVRVHERAIEREAAESDGAS